jgi:excisionase family DNA binding protein
MKTDQLTKLNSNIEQLLNKEEKPLTFREASEYLGVSKSYLYQLTHKRAISFFKPAGKMIYFTKADLNKYLFRNRRSYKSEFSEQALKGN